MTVTSGALNCHAPRSRRGRRGIAVPAVDLGRLWPPLRGCPGSGGPVERRPWTPRAPPVSWPARRIGSVGCGSWCFLSVGLVAQRDFLARPAMAAIEPGRSRRPLYSCSIAIRALRVCSPGRRDADLAGDDPLAEAVQLRADVVDEAAAEGEPHATGLEARAAGSRRSAPPRAYSATRRVTRSIAALQHRCQH